MKQPSVVAALYVLLFVTSLASANTASTSAPCSTPETTQACKVCKWTAAAGWSTSAVMLNGFGGIIFGAMVTCAYYQTGATTYIIDKYPIKGPPPIKLNRDGNMMRSTSMTDAVIETAKSLAPSDSKSRDKDKTKPAKLIQSSSNPGPARLTKEVIKTVNGKIEIMTPRGSGGYVDKLPRIESDPSGLVSKAHQETLNRFESGRGVPSRSAANQTININSSGGSTVEVQVING